MARRIPTHRKVAFLLVIGIFVVLATEGVCRFREARRGGEYRYVPLEPDPHRGSVLRPGRFEHKGRVAFINSLGMRGPEVGPKQAGVLRVLCVGGSSTYGLLIKDDESTWPAQLDRRLREMGIRAEVLNAGVPSWTLRSSQTNLELRLYSLEPDVMIVCHTFNDLVAPASNYVHDSFAEDASELWRPWRSSALLRTLGRQVDRLSPETKAARFDPALAEAFERNLRRMIVRGRKHGAEVVSTTEPSCLRPTLERCRADQIPGFEAWYSFYNTLEYEPLMQGVARFYRSTREVADEFGAPFIDLEPVVPDDGRFWGSPIHHSEEGERLIARHLASVLVERRLLASRDRARGTEVAARE